MLGLWTLLSYFFHTEYFPVIDLNTATSLLVSLVFVTVPLTAALSLTFLSTYLFAGLLIRARPTRRGNQNFIHELGSWTFFTGLGQCASGLIVVFYSLMEWPDGWALLAYASCGSRDLH